MNSSLLLFLMISFSTFLSSFSYQYTIQKSFWGKIQKIIQENDKNALLRQKVNELLYRCFEKWAINQAYEFKSHHKYKCRNIKLDDLILSSRLGLHKSIGNYKGTSSFPIYSKIYIQGELNECLTNFHPLTNIPKTDRKKSKNHFTPREKKIYKKQLETSWVPYEDFWRFDKMRKDLQEEQILLNLHEREKHAELWKKLMDQPIDPMSKKIFQYKYDYDFQVIRSNREIAELMGYSEEYVRLKLSAFCNKVKKMEPEGF
jgi:hypothetical protein